LPPRSSTSDTTLASGSTIEPLFTWFAVFTHTSSSPMTGITPSVYRKSIVYTPRNASLAYDSPTSRPPNATPWMWIVVPVYVSVTLDSGWSKSIVNTSCPPVAFTSSSNRAPYSGGRSLPSG